MSSNGNCGRPWTPYEDDLLRAAVAIHGDNTEKWKTIALSVPGRTNKACRKRWLHSLSPNVKKSAWTSEEDQLLLSLFQRYPNKWSRIARDIPGRTDDACSKRYREALDPNLKKDGWTDEEDNRLLDTLMRHGGPSNPKWGLIGQELRRSGLGCRNRWRLLERKRKSALRQVSDSQAQIATVDVPRQSSADIWPVMPESESSYWTAVFDSLGVTLDGFAVPGDAPGPIVPVGVRTEVQSQPSVDAERSLNGLVADDQRVAMQGPAGSEPPLNTASAAAAPCVSLSSSQTAPESQVARHATRNEEGMQHTVPSPSDDESTRCSSAFPSCDTFDYSVPPGDGFCLYDDDPHCSSPNEEIATHRAVDGPSPSVESSSDAQMRNRGNIDDRENFSSLGTLAHAASTLSPSPCVASASSEPEQTRQVQEVVMPPRKRRRAAADSLVSAGMHIIADIIGRPKADPKLSSSLPVGGDSSILAYICGHSACLPPGASTSSACYSTSGELLSHYKERHMYNAATSGETPFRCGLKGCNKGWKSINGLQYHLQISKVHYQHVCSRTVSRKEPLDHDSGTETASSRPSNDSSRAGTRRLHKCPYPGCLKEYKQLSGLRYHLLHGHPKEMPAQLDAIPPRIAKQLGVELASEPSVDAAPS